MQRSHIKINNYLLKILIQIMGNFIFLIFLINFNLFYFIKKKKNLDEIES